MTRTMREALIIAAAAAVALLAYGWFLNYQELRAERHLSALRDTDPERYLGEIRKVAGFAVFLGEYRQIREFDEARRAAPAFLLGRWSLAPEIKRVSDGYDTADCANPMLIENGRITFPGDAAPREPATFRIVDMSLVVTLPDGGGDVVVDLVASGIFLNHLELAVPGTGAKSFGYRCR